MRTKDEMTELAANPLIRETPAFRHLGPYLATAHAQAFVQSDRESKVIHFFGLDHLWNSF